MILRLPEERCYMGSAWVFPRVGAVSMHSKCGPTVNVEKGVSVLITVLKAYLTQDHAHAIQVFVFQGLKVSVGTSSLPQQIYLPDMTSVLKKGGGRYSFNVIF